MFRLTMLKPVMAVKIDEKIERVLLSYQLRRNEKEKCVEKEKAFSFDEAMSQENVTSRESNPSH